MAVVNTKSTQITNADAGSVTLSENRLLGGKVKALVATLEVAAADDDTSVYRFCRVHSSWLILGIMVYCDALTAGTSFDVGLHQTAANGGAVADADVFATAVDLSTAIKVGTEVRFEVSDINTIATQVYGLLALTADNNRWYDLTLTANTVGSAAGTISIQVLIAEN